MREEDPEGWSTVLITALGSWKKSVPRDQSEAILHKCCDTMGWLKVHVCVCVCISDWWWPSRTFADQMSKFNGWNRGHDWVWFADRSYIPPRVCSFSKHIIHVSDGVVSDVVFYPRRAEKETLKGGLQC